MDVHLPAGRLSHATLGVWIQRLIHIVAAADWVNEGEVGRGYKAALEEAERLLERYCYDGSQGPMAVALMMEGLALRYSKPPSTTRLPVMGRVPVCLMTELSSRGPLRWANFRGLWLSQCAVLRRENRL